MDTIIKQLSEIEHAASSVMDDANARKKAFADEIAAKTSAFDQELDAQTEAQINVLRTSREADLNTRLEKQKQNAAALLTLMEKNYEEHHQSYAEQLFQSLIKG